MIIDSKDLIEGALKVTSAVRADKVYTLSKDIVIKKFGHVKHKVIAEISTKIYALINNL